jgi:hypothetical protein
MLKEAAASTFHQGELMGLMEGLRAAPGLRTSLPRGTGSTLRSTYGWFQRQEAPLPIETHRHAKELPQQPCESHWQSKSSQACSTTKQPALGTPKTIQAPQGDAANRRCSQHFLEVNSESTAMPGNTKSTNKTHSGSLCASLFNYAESLLP